MIFKGRVVTLRRDKALLPNGHEASREVIEHPGGVTIAALTENDELLFVRQFRYPMQKVLLEIPAGKLEYGEDPLEAAKRELKEETGVTAQKVISLDAEYPSPGYCNEILHLYLATGLTYGEACPDEDEFLNVERIGLEDAVNRILSGEIKDGKTQAIVMRVYILKQKGLIK